MYQRRTFDQQEFEHSNMLCKELEIVEHGIRKITPSRERSLALTKLDEAMFWANAAIAAGNVMDHEE